MRAKPIVLTSILLLCHLRLTSTARADDWPQFRGPTGQGLSSDKNLPTTWSIKTGQNILWKSPLPKSDNPYSSPIVCRGKLITTITTNANREHHVLCFDALTGKPLWDTIIPPGPWLLTDLRGGYSAPTPACDGQRIFAFFGSCVLVALDMDGQPLWRYEFKDTAFDVAIGTSPILYKDLLIICADQNQKKSRLIAFDRAGGAVKYEIPRPNVAFAHSTPILATLNDKPELLIAASNALQGVDPDTGKIIWWCKADGDSASPVFDSKTNLAYIDSGRGSPGIAVDITGSGDVTKTHLKWRTEKPIPESLSSAVISGGHLYRIQTPGILRCIDLATGRDLYTQRLEGASPWSSPIATADGLIYLASSKTTFVVKAGPTFELVATNSLDDPNHASAAISDGRIYLKGQKFVYCISK
ncbi:MAG TPA: PQQ-binding-like beta-propeller repeat protein [Tepidisphaeraceae bacterium]|jgi:outer membrane protein assembly factor BamB|nr:PQQ-binding-like beta-propeller repeat protein [Tepidisphaeraceae bacterium]